MHRTNAVLSLFNVRPAEARLVLLLLLLFFATGLVRVLTHTAAYALFMIEFGPQALPYTYLGISVIVTLASSIYLRLSDRLPFVSVLSLSLWFLLLGLGGTRLGLLLSGGWMIFALPIGYELLWTLTHLVLWNLSGRLLNVRQGKRLFGLIASGEQAAVVVGGFSVPWLVGQMGTSNLLLAAAVALASALFLVIHIGRLFAGKLSNFSTTVEARLESEKPAASLFTNRYILLIFASFALSIIAWFFIDTMFYAEAETRYPDEEQLGAFLGVFFAIIGLLTLFSTSFLSSRVFSRYGLRGALLITPVAISVGTGAMMLFGSTGGSSFVLFFSIVVTRLLNGVLYVSIDTPSLNILYQPLSAGERVRVQTATEGILYPVAVGSAGFLLLILISALSFGTVQLAYVAFGLLVARVLVAVLLGQQYPLMLIQALVRRRLSGTQLLATDASSVAVLQQGLQSPHPGMVIYALSALEALSEETVTSALISLLAHPDPMVRKDVLERIERRGVRAALPDLRHRVAHEQVPAIRGIAIRTLAALGDSAVLGEIMPYLEDPEPDVRAGAIAGLLRSGGIEGVLAAGQMVLRMVDAPEPAERMLAARLLGDVGVQSFYQPLVPLLHDADTGVRQAAIRAAGQLRNPILWPLVLEALANPSVRKEATVALIAGGETLLPELRTAFERSPQDTTRLIDLAQICGRLGGDGAIALLRERLDVADERLRTEILRSLRRCGYRAEGEEASHVRRQIEAEVAWAAWLLAALVGIGTEGESPLLHAALTNALARTQRRVLYLLSFLYDSRSISRVQATLSHPSANKRAYALEIIDLLVAKELKVLLFPLLNERSPEERLQQLSASFPQPHLSRAQWLERLISNRTEVLTPWIQACALYSVGQLQIVELREAVAEAQLARDPLVRQTASWALSRIDQVVSTQANEIYGDPRSEDGDTALSLSTGGDAMFLTIEKVLILKSVSLFAGTPDDILAEVAALLEEAEYQAGETIFEQGELGTSLYIIVAGEVRVHDGELTLNHLGEHEIFGEMALLDPEPRMASVTAVVDTLLLRLDQDSFYDLMEQCSEIALGIIRVLSQRLRARVRDLNETQARLKALERPPTAVGVSTTAEPRQSAQNRTDR
ncbi:MAG: HEAT repeat domain-containing protein [Chloroflexota bacterium]|nr:HEAT repeat domain-containing protein [Chloroflexota bacterium]